MNIDRRKILSSSIYGAAALIAAGLGIPAAGYLLAPPKQRRPSRWVDAGDLAALEPGEPRQVTFERTHVDGWKVVQEQAGAWVVKQPDGTVAAFDPRCTHLGCAYHWEKRDRRFVCPCHGSQFGADGRVLAGPAPRPLDRYETRLEGARLLLGPVENREARS